MSKARLAAILAIGLGALALGVAVYSVISEFPRGPIIAALLIAAAVCAWHGLIRRGVARVVGVSCAALLVLAVVLFVILDGGVPEALVIGAAAFGALAAARTALVTRVALPDAVPPAHPVLFFNPKSGGGKAEKFKLADEARARGIEPIELTRGTDLEQLVRDAVARGADGLAMAGGDGSQAIVASIAAELDLPYACIPAGTRNHFALDLGVDRDDVVGALDSVVDGGERRVDLAEVNGRVFVNNVSRSCGRSSTPCPTRSGPRGRGLTSNGPDRAAPSTRPGRRSSFPTTSTGSAWRSGPGPGLTSTTACSESRSPPRPPQAAESGRGHGVSGQLPSSRSAPRARSPPASTARRSSSARPFGSACSPRSCGCGSPASIPAPHHPPRSQNGSQT